MSGSIPYAPACVDTGLDAAGQGVCAESRAVPGQAGGGATMTTPSTTHAAAGVLPGQTGRLHCTGGGSFSGSKLDSSSSPSSSNRSASPADEPSFSGADRP